jgi:hypothetical protein
LTEEVEKAKELAFYGASVEAWYNTRLERDKSLLTLSTGGIGLLLTLIAAFGIHSAESLVLYVLALMAFVVCLGAVLWIFQRNSEHLVEVIHHREKSDLLLEVLDKIAISTFLAGVALSSVLGIAGAVRSFQTQEQSSMTKSDKTVVKTVMVGDSYNRAADLRPDFRRSFSGAAKLLPDTAQVQTSQGTTSQSQSQTSQQSSTPATPITPTKK